MANGVDTTKTTFDPDAFLGIKTETKFDPDTFLKTENTPEQEAENFKNNAIKSIGDGLANIVVEDNVAGSGFMDKIGEGVSGWFQGLMKAGEQITQGVTEWSEGGAALFDDIINQGTDNIGLKWAQNNPSDPRARAYLEFVAKDRNASDIVRGAARTTLGAISTIISTTPVVAAFEASSPLLKSEVQKTAKSVGLDPKATGRVFDHLAPFIFGKKVGVASLLSTGSREAVTRSGILKGLSPEDQALGLEAITNGVFFGVLGGFQKRAQTKAEKIVGTIAEAGKIRAEKKAKQEAEIAKKFKPEALKEGQVPDAQGQPIPRIGEIPLKSAKTVQDANIIQSLERGIDPIQIAKQEGVTKSKVLDVQRNARLEKAEGARPLTGSKSIIETGKTLIESSKIPDTIEFQELTSSQPIIKKVLTPTQLFDFYKTEQSSKLSRNQRESELIEKFGVDKRHINNIRETTSRIAKAERVLEAEAKKGGLPAPTEKQILNKAGIVKNKDFTAKTFLGEVADVIKDVKEARRQTDLLYAQERGARLAQASKALEGKTGQEAFTEARSKLGGELGKADFKPKTFTEPQGVALMEAIRRSDLTIFDKISAFEGFQKLIGQTEGIPQPKQIELLERAWGTKLPRTPLGLRKFGKLAIDVLNVPRALMSTGEFSAVLRQGLLAAVSNPKKAAKTFNEGLKYLRSEKAFEALQESINKDPAKGLADISGLEITTIAKGKREKGFKGVEESFSSEIAERIPGIGKAVRGFERFHVGYLNKMRMDIFKDLTQNLLEKEGISFKSDPKAYQDIAKIINWSTGRAKLGKNLEKIAPALNTIIWSPKNLAAKLQLLNIRNYLPENMGGNLTKAARVKLSKDMLKLVGAQTSLLYLMDKIDGVSAEADPRSSDFGKIRVGKMRIDMWGGLQQVARFYAQFISGQTKSIQSGIIRDLDGKSFPFNTRVDLTQNFVRSKLSPGVGLVVDIMDGMENMVGEKVEFSINEAIKRTAPLYYQDALDAAREMGIGGVLLSVPGAFGAGVQTFKPRKSKTKIIR